MRSTGYDSKKYIGIKILEWILSPCIEWILQVVPEGQSSIDSISDGEGEWLDDHG